MREYFKSLNGLLLIWGILGFLVLAIIVQQLLMVFLMEKKLGVKVIKVFGPRKTHIDEEGS